MTFYRCEFKVISRGQGRSALRAAAYRAAEKLSEHEREGPDLVGAAAYRSGSEIANAEGRTFDYSRKSGVIFTSIELPDGAPAAFADRGTLWRAVEDSHKRCDARLARECLVALPRELPREARIDLAVTFAREQFVSRGMVADIAVHETTGRGGNLAPHAHILLSTRSVGPDGFGPVDRSWNAKAFLCETREAWAEHVNAALLEHGIERTVTHESLAKRLEHALETGDFETAAKVDRLPEPKLGPAVAKMEALGQRTDLGDELREVRAINAERAELYAAVREVAEDVPEAPGRFLEMRAASDDPVGAFEQWGEWAREALGQLREMAIGAVERVQEVALSAWDMMVSAMCPLSDFHVAELAAAEEREAELDRAIDEVLAEMDAPEPQHECDDREQEHAAEVEAPELEPEDDWLADLLDEMDDEDVWDRGHDREHGIEHEM